MGSGKAHNRPFRFGRRVAAAFAVYLFAVLSGFAAPLGSTITLQSSAGSSIFGQPVKLTATVSPAAATGKVTFYDGASVLGIGTLSGGQAVITTTSLAAGARYLRALYSGDTVYAASGSPLLFQTVTALAQRGFQAALGYNTPFGGAEYVAVGDFNGDGIPDLAIVGNSGFPVFLSQLTILLGSLDGVLRPGFTAGLSGTPHAIVTGDFNGDGRLDLAVAAGNNVGVMLGNGDSTFQKAINHDVGAANSVSLSLAAGDFNGDGLVDLAWGGTTVSGAAQVGVLLGGGDGTLQAAVNYSAGSSPNAIAIGDFNGDGEPDLAVTNGGVSVLLGNGDGTLQAPVDYGTGHKNATSLAIADFNGDSRADIAFANATANSVSVLLGNGDGSFSVAVDYQVVGDPVALAAGDFNGDGRIDLVTADFANGGVSTLLGNGNGTFQTALTYDAVLPPGFVAVADFNRDGRSDLALSYPNNFLVGVMLGAALPVTPVIWQNGVINGASLQPGIAPGSWLTILGSSFSTVTDVWNQAIVNGALPTTLDGLRVSIGGKQAYVEYISAGQINVLAPDMGTGAMNVIITSPNGTSSAFPITAQQYSPAFFLWNGVYAVATHADFSLAAKPGLFPGLATVAAKPGETIILWGTGFGPTNPTAPPGAQTPSDQNYFAASTVTATIGGVDAPVGYAVLAPGFAGLYQIAIQVPVSAPDGDALVVATVGGVQSPGGVRITVQH